MITMIGNKKAQDEIRSLSPDREHCAFLIVSEFACQRLPQHADLPSDSVGKPCPNNPRMNPKFAKKYSAATDSTHLFREAVRCRDMIELNIVPPIDKIDPTTYQICRTVKENMRSAEQSQRMRSIEQFMGIFGYAGR